ncbi:MAG: MFS transporter [Actinobacteria bacterium 13_2_20CM_2_72_6]|nr:MAG: MFS transporter [Actinobacteria bacterium 13_2_20CM_2_72_6]
MFRAALPENRAARRILLGTLFSAIGRGLTLPFLFVYLNQVRGLHPGTVGLLVGWMGLVGLALAPVGGTLVDRYGARRVVLPLFAVEAVGTASLGFVHSVASAFVALTVVAVGTAAVFSGQNTILASLVPDAQRQHVFGLWFTLLNLGIGIGGMLSAAVVDLARPVTFQAIYFTDAVTYLVPAAILLSLPHVGRRLAAPPPRDGQAAEPAARRTGYREVLRDKAFVRLVIFGLTLTTCGYAQIEVGFTAFSTHIAHVTPRIIGWALAGNTLMIVGSQLFVLRFLHHRSRTYALAGVGVIFSGSWLVLAAGGLAGRHGHVVLAAAGVIGCAMVFAVGETLLSPVMPALTNALATDELRGRYNAMTSIIWGISGIVGPITAGPLIGAGRAGLWVVTVVAGCLLASTLALGLHRRLTPEQDGRIPIPDSETPGVRSTARVA